MITENENIIKRLIGIDFDGCLFDTFESEIGKLMWEKHYNKKFSHLGWWSKPESLDLDVFDIKPFPSILNILKKEVANPESYVIILTSRMEKLRPEVEAVLNKNHIHVDKVDMKRSERTKGEKILRYIEQLPELEEIDVYDDRESDIVSYKQIELQIPENIKFRIFLANQGQLRLLESTDKLTNIVQEEIQNFISDDNYVYHGTYDGAGYSIQRDGRMKINAANNGEPFISFTSKPNTAKYYADMKGGSDRGIVLRTKKTNDFQLSPKFKRNNGFEWITTREIPIEELEINTKYGWIPLNNWDFIDRDIKN